MTCAQHHVLAVSGQTECFRDFKVLINISCTCCDWCVDADGWMAFLSFDLYLKSVLGFTSLQVYLHIHVYQRKLGVI